MNDSSHFQIDYYFSDKILKQLKIKENSNIFKVETNNLIAKISENNLKSQKYDFVIIGTAHRYFNTFLKISKLFKTITVIHNINFANLNSAQLFLNIFKKESVYRLKLLLNEGLFLKNKLYKNVKSLFVLDEDLKNCNKEFQYLPVFYSLKNENKVAENLSIVIPGSVSQNRRDYNLVLKELENYATKNSLINSTIEIVFLGKAENKELNWLINFKNKNLENVKIIYFREKVSQNDFDFYMQKATFLWCPLQLETNFFSQKEYYATTKMPGVIGDAIKYRKVVYLPDWYYSSELFIQKYLGDISEMVQHFIQLEKMEQFADFEKSEVLKNLETTLEDLI